jgi:hypothetical protein
MLAQCFREYPTWGDGYIAEKERADKLAQLLDDASEAIGALHSEAWDMLSQSTRDETSEVMRRIDEVLGA